MDPQGTPSPGAFGGPTTVPVGGKGLGSRIKEAYNAASQRAGRHLSWDDPTVLLIWQVLGGLTPEQARQASERGAQYAHTNGRLLSGAEVDQMLGEVKTGTPAQFDPAYGAGQSIQQAFQDVSAEFPGEVLQGNDPRLLAAIRRDPQLTGLTDEQIGSVVQTGRQFTHGTGLMAGAGLDQMVGSMLQRSIPQAHQMSPFAFDQIQQDPVSKALFEGALGRRGYDPASYYGAHLAARPKGTAPKSTGSVARQIAGVF